MKELSGSTPEKKSNPNTEIGSVSDPGEVIRRKKETFDAIGTGDIQPGQPWKQGEKSGDGLDATLKVIRAKDAVATSIRKTVDETPDAFQPEIARLRDALPKIEEGVKKGYVSSDILAHHKGELTVFQGFTEKSPAEKPYIRRGVDGRIRRHEDDPEFSLPETGETFYGDHAQVVRLIFNSPTEYMHTDAIGKGLWGEEEYLQDKPRYYGKVKRLLSQIKLGLEDTDWKMESRTDPYYGGFTIAREGVPVPHSERKENRPGRVRRSPQDPEFSLPETGETFFGNHALFLNHLFNAGENYSRWKDIAKRIWPELKDSALEGRIQFYAGQIKNGLEDTGWKIDGKRGVGIRMVRKEEE